jgi:hypothetical protein
MSRESKVEGSPAGFDSAAFLEKALGPEKAKDSEGIPVVAKESRAPRKTGRVGAQVPLSVGLILSSSISSSREMGLASGA